MGEQKENVPDDESSSSYYYWQNQLEMSTSLSDDPKKSKSATPPQNLQIDQNLLYSALTGLELILRDGKNSAIKLLQKENTLQMLLSSFKQIFVNHKNENENSGINFDLEIRQQVCKILGCFSMLYD